VTAALVVVLYLPVLVWIASGVGLVIAYRRSAPVVVLRLAATFLGLWALLATTTLIWVLANGGWAAILVLVRSPLTIFDPRWATLWFAGALGALAVFVVAFLLNQLVGRGFLHVLHPTPLPWPHRLPRPEERTSLLRYPSTRAEAFSFTLLAMPGGGRRAPHRHEVILLSDELLARLEPAEVEAAVAHELGHIRGLDARYLTFVRTLSRMMRWDPLLAYLASSLTRREEYRADDEAASLTGNPLALARALYKAAAMTTAPPGAGATAFLGAVGRRGRYETMRRIERLIALAESGRYAGAEAG
jgi:Zn-dependent protease with chaperone function